jgi:hypothetical protein
MHRRLGTTAKSGRVLKAPLRIGLGALRCLRPAVHSWGQASFRAAVLGLLALAASGAALALFSGNDPASADAPLDTMTTPQGTAIESYSPLVRAQDVYSTLLANGYNDAVGSSIVRVEVRDDGLTMTSSSVGFNQDGSYRPQSTMQLGSSSYLAHPNNTVGHEYGHAWSHYYRWTVWNGSWDVYLEARGLLGDPRVESSYCWKASEMIAEDYRQLLAAPDPAITGADQCNFQIPEAAEVPGLRDFLALTWTNGDAPPTYGGGAPVPTATSTAVAAPTRTVTPVPTATATLPPPTPTRTATPALPPPTPVATATPTLPPPTPVPTATPAPPPPTPIPTATPTVPPPAPTPAATPTSTSVSPAQTATITLDRGWQSFVAPVTGSTDVAVYESRTGKKNAGTYLVVQGMTYWAKGPTTITITAQ